ncbi:coiled-coil domain-containing protein 63 [Scaptodrosophila lebanonensis]|uniref:Coiled-coil domain-containing protein 63 n=1 Tax=Drosophila lebanonensis TaxID=7225 RepID=A0A6J2TKY7_DROLE|nr:coiled-coil domain-containing protein 63 [Scaptodrosophila lebanonensis]
MADQNELDQLATAELLRLQRQHRCLKLDLQGLLEEKSKRLKKQTQTINSLQLDCEKLRNEVKSLEGGTHARRNYSREKHLGSLQKQKTELQRVLQAERSNLWELEGHIKKMEKEIDALRRNEIPDNCYKDTIGKVQKSVVKLENRLDVVNKKCSDVLTENSKMRDAINHMLQDRSNFNDMWQSMVAEFNDGKKYIMDLIDQSTLAFDQREELSNKVQVLKDRNENDKIMHIQEMREMQRRLEHDAQLQKFYDTKGQRRLNPELEQRENDKKKAQKESFERQLFEYKDIIEKIKHIYSEQESGRLVAQFKRQEDENFALFNYVNELSHEVEVLNDSTQELVEEIERQKSEKIDKEVKMKTEAVDYLNSELFRIEQMVKSTKQNKCILCTRLQDLLKGIENIFKQLSCTDAPILSILSCKPFLTIHNVKLHIGVIERRINLVISTINIEDNSNKILAKKDRIPKFNLRESIKNKN